MNFGFLFNFLKNPLRNASVTPSSKAAVLEILKDIDFDTIEYIVELGPGTGVFTHELLRRIQPTAKLMAIELEGSYIEQLQSANSSQLEVIQGSACELKDFVERRGWPRIDLVVSSLPFVLPEQVKIRLFDYLLACTQGGTTLRYFTYMPILMKPHYKDFNMRRRGFVLWNLPPMWVYSVN